MPEPLLGLNETREFLLRTQEFTLFRLQREGNSPEVLYKINHIPNAASLLAHEYALLRDAVSPCFPEASGIEEIQGELALVMRTPKPLENGFRTFRDIFKRQRSSLDKFRGEFRLNIAQILGLMVAITERVEMLHQDRIVHCAFAPEHFCCSFHAMEDVVQLHSSEIFLLHGIHALRQDDNSVTTFSSPATPPQTSRHTFSDVRYLAPEQAGNVGKTLDARTDLYALGCMFYELLTGKAPFEAGSEYPDTLSLLHAHIAIEPIAPYLLNVAVPQELSAIVMKLLKKNPDERYQSAAGLRRDVQECVELWREKSSLQGFVAGAKDRSSLFILPTTLVGRENELRLLTETFLQAANGKPHLFLLGGYAGAGKSALVRELYKQISRGNIPHAASIMLSGKFDQVKQDIPYGVLVQCMEEFAQRILSESASVAEHWKSRILEALGANAAVLASAFPALERIVGEQMPVQELGAQESQNRFRLVAEQFVRLLAQPEHPLVLFLDDMQWADEGTLSLLTTILQSAQDAALLVVCAFRSNETDERHIFIQTASQLESAGVPTVQIEIAPLQEDDICRMVAETLFSKPDEIKDTAALLYEKTQGNPFFTVQLLRSLYRAGAIWFDHAEYVWKCDNDAIAKAHVADNVVELLSQRVRELSEETQHILQLAACMGNRFETDILSIIAKTSPQRVCELLHQAEQAGLVHNIPDGKSGDNGVYAFIHDRVQQAAYSMIPENKRSVQHLGIARLLQQQLPEHEREERLFDIVAHYNKALGLIDDNVELTNLAGLNLAAARKAKKNAVYSAAAEYLRVFAELTNESFWQTHYAIMREASIIGAEVGYAVSDDALLEYHSNRLSEYGRTLIDCVQGEKVKIEAYAAQGRYSEAVMVGRRILAKFGVHLPQNSSKFTAVVYLLRLRNVIGHLKNRPHGEQEKTVSEEQGEVMNILRRFTVAAITGSQNLLPAIVYVACKISLEKGFVATSGYFFFIAGIIMRSLFSENILADRCLQAGLYFRQRNGENDPDVLRGQVSYAATTGYWYDAPAENMRQIEDWERSLYSFGVVEEAQYCALHYAAEGLQSSTYLGELAATIREKVTFLHKKPIEISIYAGELWYQVMMRLQESEPLWNEFSTLNGEYFLEKDRFQSCIEKNNTLIMGYSYCHKVHLAVLAHQYSKAIDFHREFGKYKDTAAVSSLYHWQHLYLGIAYSSLVQQGEKQYWRQFKRILKTLEKWASWSKMFHHRYQCLQAELCMHNALVNTKNTDESRTDEAEFWFQKASASAERYGFLGDEALIAERAGMWFHLVGNTTKAYEYLRTAYLLYGKWGASALQAMMRSHYAEYFEQFAQLSPQPSLFLETQDFPQSLPMRSLDMLAVMKASQALAGEIAFPSLLEKMLRVTAESSGAHRVVLLVNQVQRFHNDGKSSVRPSTKSIELRIQAELDITGSISLLENTPLAVHETLPKSIIEHSANTHETVILRHAAEEGAYTTNSYLSAHRVKSVFSMPVLNQGSLIGVLYAENNLLEGAFTGDRVEILTMLGSQMAISIENALLVESMTKMERLKKEMEMAAEVQLQMLPKEFPAIPGYEIAAFLSMAKEAGGDFYDVLPLDNARYLLVIGDVSGKGMPAALFMSAMVNTVRTQVKYLSRAESNEISPKRILEIANAMARQSMTRRNFVTMMVAVLDADKHTLTFSTAGHDPAMKWNPSERSLEQLRTDGIACNFGTEEVFAAKTHERCVEIEQGAFIFWNTDGITEAKNEEAEEFQDKRYWSAIMDITSETSPQKALEEIVERVRSFQGEKPQYDDMTLLALKRIR